MTNKISFPHGTEWGVIGPDGDYDLPVESVLGHRFQLVDGVVVDRYDGVTDDEVKDVDARRAADKVAADLQAAKDARINEVKREAGERIAALNWKTDRARERDFLNGTKKLREIYAEREAIREASDQAEADVAALNTLEEIRAFSW